MDKRVLVVDDLQFMRTALRDILEQAGYEICAEAEDGMEGVIHYIEEKPSITLLDIAMPIMDGITALKKIIGYDSSAKIIMCSALGEQDMIVRAIQLGAKDFIVKPFKPERILSAVERVLQSEN